MGRRGGQGKMHNVSYLGEQSRHTEGVEHSGTHDDGDLQSKRKSDQLVSVALDEVSI